MKPAKGDKGACDRLTSLLVRSRGACQRCGSPSNLQAAHIISRRYAATRCNLANLWALCPGCHMYVDEHFDAKYRLTVDTIGLDTFTELSRLAQSNRGRWDWAAERERLTALVKAASGAAS